MKSSVHEPCSESLYRAHHQHTPTPSFVVETWKDDDRKMVDELASQLWNREEVSLHPYGTASWLQKSCHGKFSNSKTMCSTPPLYKAVPQVLEIRVPLLKREDIHHGANAVSLVFHREDTRKCDGKSITALEVWVSELKGKKLQKEKPFCEKFPRKLLLQFPVGSSKEGRKADLSSDINKDTFYLHLQEGKNKYYVQD